MKERLRHPRRTDWVGWSLDGELGDEEAGGHDEERPRLLKRLLLHLAQPALPSPHQCAMAPEALQLLRRG